VAGDLVEVADAAEVVAARGDFGAVGFDVVPGAAELRDLLLQGEPGEQCLDPLGDGEGGIGPGAVVLGVVSRPREAAVVRHGGRHSRLLWVLRGHADEAGRTARPRRGANWLAEWVTWRNRR
jgi:hypothetical protein